MNTTYKLALILFGLFFLLMFTSCDQAAQDEADSADWGDDTEYSEFLQLLAQGNVIFDGTGTVTKGDCEYPATIWLGIYAPISVGDGLQVNPVEIHAVTQGGSSYQSPCTIYNTEKINSGAKGIYEAGVITFETCSMPRGASGIAELNAQQFYGSYTCRYVDGNGDVQIGYKVTFSARRRE